MLALAMVTCLLPSMSITAEATEVYVVGNGVTIPNSDVPADGTNKYCNCGVSVGSGTHKCCWMYGYFAFYHIWGEYQDKEDTSAHYLRNVPAEDRTLTTANLKKYLKNAVPGALVRIDEDSAADASDQHGHTLIFIQMNEAGDGAIMLEGNYDGKGRTRIHDWKFSELVEAYGPDSEKGYQYIKYISWPDAPEYAPSADGHTCQFVPYTTAPTCTEFGYTFYLCYECGESYLDDLVPPTGHSYVGGECEHCGEADPNAPETVTGDVNGDGIINYLDAMLIAQYYVGDIGEAGLNLDAADVNGDGTVNYLDAMMVAQYYVGSIDSFE